MHKAITVLAVVTLASFQSPVVTDDTAVRLKEEAMILKYTPSADEIVVEMSAESEDALTSVDILNPTGASVLRMRAESGGKLALSGYVVESRETNLAELFGAYPEGVYRIRARTADGRIAKGEAALSYVLPAAPHVVYPLEGASDVPASGLVIRWNADAAAAGYRVGIEQGESDGLAVHLPPGTDSFQVPDGVLAPHTKTKIEVIVIGQNGNQTQVEFVFTTS